MYHNKLIMLHNKLIMLHNNVWNYETNGIPYARHVMGTIFSSIYLHLDSALA